MSSHHGHHRRSHHRSSRSRHSGGHHNRNRNTANNHNGANNSNHPRGNIMRAANGTSEWSEHRSSNGKLYYYNTRTGVSQWDLPAELRPQQERTHHQHNHNSHDHHQSRHQHNRNSSPNSDISESSSIRHQQDNSPSSSATSNSTSNSDIHDDKPMLTPNLNKYYKPELIASIISNQYEDLESQANQYTNEALRISEKVLAENAELKTAKSIVRTIDTHLLALEVKYAAVKDAIRKNDLSMV